MLRMSSASTSLGATPLCMQHENSKKYTKILNVKSSGPVAIYTTAKKNGMDTWITMIMLYTRNALLDHIHVTDDDGSDIYYCGKKMVYTLESQWSCCILGTRYWTIYTVTDDGIYCSTVHSPQTLMKLYPWKRNVQTLYKVMNILEMRRKSNRKLNQNLQYKILWLYQGSARDKRNSKKPIQRN